MLRQLNTFRLDGFLPFPFSGRGASCTGTASCFDPRTNCDHHDEEQYGQQPWPGGKHPPPRTSRKGDAQRGTVYLLSAMYGYNHGQLPTALLPGAGEDACCSISRPLESGLDNQDAYMVSLVWSALESSPCPLACTPQNRNIKFSTMA